ncbi:hypothetical protein [Streptomyces sp. NPDC048521]|uniref:hypothetical protein n=1 Tax=Streptomyces sp. NPDC048521 TaxID=3365566 RepID=UPI003713692A
MFLATIHIRDSENPDTPSPVRGVRRDLTQSQVYLGLLDTRDQRKQVVIRAYLTATAEQHDAVLADFQAFVRTVRPHTEQWSTIHRRFF